jgi:hypothetical protein
LKKLILFVITISYSILGNAQAIIPKIGISQSTVTFSDQIRNGATVNSKTGLVVGFGIELPVNKYIAVQPEVLFHQKGWIDHAKTTGRTAKETFTLNYVEIPVLLKLKVSILHLHAGPFVAFGIGGKYRYTETIQGVKSSGSEKIRFGKRLQSSASSTDIYFDNAVDAGIQMGFGLTLFKIAVLDFRYSRSLVDIYDQQPGLSDNKSRNNGYQFTVGFPMPKD